jgi:hypothetical protein
MTALRQRVTLVTVVSLLAIVALVAPTAAQASARDTRHVASKSALPGALRFNAPIFATTGCVTPTLTYSGSLTPTIVFVSKVTGDYERLSLTKSSANTWTRRCLPLATKKGRPDNGTLQVAPGDGVFAFARSHDTILAIGAVTISGNRVGLSSVPTLLVKPATLPAALAGGPLGPNARLIGPGGVTTYFAEHAVVVSDAVPGDLAAFVRRYHGTDLGPTTIGDPAMGESVFHTVQLDPSHYNDANFASLLASQHVKKGTYTFSSALGRKLLAIVTAEQTAGLSVWPEVLQVDQSTPSTNEGKDTKGNTINYFGEEWSNPSASDGSQQVRLGEAQALLHVLKIPSGSFTNLAVLDAGFGGPNDYGGGFTPPDYGAPGGLYQNIPQCSIDAKGGADCNPLTGPAQGMNTMACSGGGSCPWHGLWMASVAGGRIDNAWGGSAGTGAQTSNLHLYKIASNYTVPLAAAINLAVLQGAKVISISSGASCKVNGIDLCTSIVQSGLKTECASLPLRIAFGDVLGAIAAQLACDQYEVVKGFNAIANAVSFAEAANVVVVAAGGNSHEDPAAIDLYPCNVTDVLCVGGLQPGSPAPVAVPTFSFGPRINIWAPGKFVPAMPDPGSGGQPSFISGTSPATAFIAGVASIARTVDSALTAAQTRALIEGTACRPGNLARIVGPSCTASTDPAVNGAGYVDVLEVLRKAWSLAGQPSLGVCTGGFDENGGVAGTGDSASIPTLLGNFPAALSGTFVDQMGIDASLTDMDHANDPGTDVRWYSFSLTGSIPGHAAVNVKASITVPDPGLGTFQLAFYRLVGNSIGPPKVEAVPAGSSQDTSSGTGFVEAPIVIGSKYALVITPVGPLALNTNCFGEIKLEAQEAAPNPPPHEPWLEVGGAVVVSPTGNAADTRTVLVPVSLTGALAYDATVNYSFTDVTAVGGTDYSNTPGSFVIPAGQVNGAIPVQIFPSAPTTGIYADINVTSNAPVLVPTGYIAIDPAPSGGAVNVGDCNVWEGDTGGPRFAHVTVSLDAATTRPITVDYTMHDGTAIAGTDYSAVTSSIVIPAGATTADIPIQLTNPNTLPEFDKTFTVQLTNTSAGAGLLGGHATATVTILDDDPMP